MDRSTYVGLITTIGAVSTFAGHYMYDLYARRKFTCELPSDVIKALHTEYGVALEVSFFIHILPFAHFLLLVTDSQIRGV